MSQSVSSAEPEKLFRYSDVATGIDHALVSESHRLAGRLGHFETRCTEPGYKVSVSHLADALRSHGSQSEYTDGWVRDVGKAFQLADGMRSGWRSPPVSPVERLVVLPALPGLAIALLLPILRVPDWLGRLFPTLPWFKPEAERVPTETWPRPEPEQEPPEPAPTSRLGELLEQAEHTPAPVESGFGELLKDQRLVHDVPAKSQGSLFGSAACSFTTVSMVLDYYHAQDEKHPTASPQELIDMRDAGDGTSGKGVALTKLTDELNDLGYEHITVKANASLQDLKDQVSDVPVIVTMGVGIVGPGTIKSDVPRAITGPGNTIHAMVVKGFSPDGKSVVVNDPWTGKELEYPVEQFEDMWARGGRGLYVIRP